MLPIVSDAGYVRPRTLEEALRILAQPGARVLAGGTDLLPSMKHGLHVPHTLVAIGHLPELQGVRVDGDTLVIGAATPLRAVVTHPDVSRLAPALGAAARTVGTPTIQAMGTLGGNLALDTRCVYYNQPEGWRRGIGGCLKCDGSVCHVAPKGRGCYAAHSADTVPALILLDASVEIHHADTRDTRVSRVEDLYDGTDGRSWLRLAPGELIGRIRVPRERTPIAYRKGRLRAAIDYGYLLVAAQRRTDGLHAVIGAVAPAPVRVHAADVDTLVEAAHAAAQPLGTHLPSPAWRRRMVAVELRRAVASLGG